MTTTTKEQSTGTTWGKIKSMVDGGQGISQLTMGELRDAEGAERLGPKVIAAIEAKIATLGMGTLPTDLPNRMDEQVILYSYGTPVSDVVLAVRNGLTGTVAEDVFRALARLNRMDVGAVTEKVTETVKEAVSEAVHSAM